MQRGMLQPGAKTEGCRRERQNSRRLHMGRILSSEEEGDHQAFPHTYRLNLLCNSKLLPFAKKLLGQLQLTSVRLTMCGWII